MPLPAQKGRCSMYTTLELITRIVATIIAGSVLLFCLVLGSAGLWQVIRDAVNVLNGL